MPQLLEHGHIFLAQPPLYKVTRKQREEYVDSDEQLTHKLLQLGSDDISLRLPDGRTLPEGDLLALLDLLVSIENTLHSLTRRGVDPRDLLRRRRPDTGVFPRFLVAIGTGEGADLRFAFTDAELAAARADAERTLKTGIDLAATRVPAYHRNAPMPFSWLELFHAVPLKKSFDRLAELGFTVAQYLGESGPIAWLVEGDQEQPLQDLPLLLEDVRTRGRKGLSIQRYKGLGEMNPDQLYATTMDPAKRRLLRVVLEDVVKADTMFTLLMGDEVEPRRRFIEENALNVRNLDV
jgi:DNA gyrase subunit B